MQSAAAASHRHRTVSEFVLESALARAGETLADRRVYELTPPSGGRFLPLSMLRFVRCPGWSGSYASRASSMPSRIGECRPPD